MQKSIALYHGSRNIVGRPSISHGDPHRDFGRGFYCTRNKEIASEWACPDTVGGYVNEYVLNTKGLNILDLSKMQSPLLTWLFVVTNNRRFSGSDFLSRATDFLQSAYFIDTEDYDVIIGPRCDDSYYSFTYDFLINSIPYRRLSSSINFRRECEQIVITSKKGLDNLEYMGSEPVDSDEFFRKRCERDIVVRSNYLERGKTSSVDEYDIMMEDLLTGRVETDDPRLQ